MKKPIKRDRKGLDKTLRYLIHDRGHLPTTVKRVAADMKISPGAASMRLSTLADLGKIKRVVRGLYKSSAGTQLSMAFGPQPDSNTELLSHLLKERERIDVKIANVRDVMKEVEALKKSSGK